MRLIIFILLGAFILSCAPRDPGFITLANTGVEQTKVKISGRTFKINPANHITKELAAGTYQITVDGAKTYTADIVKGLTTVFDSTGLACYVVADFTQRHRGGGVEIAERFSNQRVFTAKSPITTIMGWRLPDRPKEGHRYLRLHQIDCEIIDDDPTIVRELANIP